jgi:hypothetical protein
VRSGWIKQPDTGAIYSAGVAVTNGIALRSRDNPGRIYLDGTLMLAAAMVDAGLADAEGVAFVLNVEAAYEPAKPTIAESNAAKPDVQREATEAERAIAALLQAVRDPRPEALRAAAAALQTLIQRNPK